MVGCAARQSPVRSRLQSTLPRPPTPPLRSWEALDGELAAIGVHPHCWPLPLTLLSVREAEKNPIAQPIPQMPAVKRGSGGDGGESVVRVGRGRGRGEAALGPSSQHAPARASLPVLSAP